MKNATLLALVCMGLSAGCGSASDAEAVRAAESFVISWEGTAARICVTEPGVACPQGKDDKIEGGRVYWVIDASCWPGGIDRPVQYGVVPNCGKDKTADHKGTWEAPQPGVTYKVSVAGFGGDITETEVAW